MASLPPDMDRALQDQIGAGLRDYVASVRRFAEDARALADEIYKWPEDPDADERLAELERVLLARLGEDKPSTGQEVP